MERDYHAEALELVTEEYGGVPSPQMFEISQAAANQIADAIMAKNPYLAWYRIGLIRLIAAEAVLWAMAEAIHVDKHSDECGLGFGSVDHKERARRQDAVRNGHTGNG